MTLNSQVFPKMSEAIFGVDESRDDLASYKISPPASPASPACLNSSPCSATPDFFVVVG
ncbi:hypothetical protein H6G18_08625 [Anabaena subtropica FACHB-260]|uniref:Uncharacterized protein n=1 Tax=Anabaena subtropica FACHB-260 TaxID=2692884 RepID=A0ABR8CMW6_9NOST|nr:hypothetical protein [Anabaena subtropica FACHB-260]